MTGKISAYSLAGVSVGATTYIDFVWCSCGSTSRLFSTLGGSLDASVCTADVNGLCVGDGELDAAVTKTSATPHRINVTIDQVLSRAVTRQEITTGATIGARLSMKRNTQLSPQARRFVQYKFEVVVYTDSTR